MRDDLLAIGEDETVQQRWPILAALFTALAEVVPQAEHDMDWDICGDTCINNDREFDLRSAGKLLDSVLKALPDEVFERGKWATIQAWQQRTGSEATTLRTPAGEDDGR
jgi:hypothetical protein